jgi:hypothetical protein
MAGVLVLLAIMLIFSTVVFQSWDEVLRRDNEAEMIFRAEEIVRAMQRYRKDFGAPPEKLEQLLEPGPKAQYYLRRAYTDPLVKNGKWGLLYAGPSGEIIDPNAPMLNLTEGQLDLAGISDKARIRKRLERDKSLLGQGQPPGARGSKFEPLRDEGQASEMGGGRQYGGLRLAGVRTLCSDEPFRVYKGQLYYREWLFTWVDLEQPKLPGQDQRRGRGRGNQPGSLGGLERTRPRGSGRSPGDRGRRGGRR